MALIPTLLTPKLSLRRAIPSLNMSALAAIMYIQRICGKVVKVSKEAISVRIDEDLLERARAIAEWKKTTVTQLLTDGLLNQVKHWEQSKMREERDAKRLAFAKPRLSMSSQKREQVRASFSYTCQSCGITEVEWMQSHPNEPAIRQRLQIDHRQPQANFTDKRKANSAENLTLLCPDCHYQKTLQDEIDYGSQ